MIDGREVTIRARWEGKGNLIELEMDEDMDDCTYDDLGFITYA